jgi:hypothetical protein
MRLDTKILARPVMNLAMIARTVQIPCLDLRRGISN